MNATPELIAVLANATIALRQGSEKIASLEIQLAAAHAQLAAREHGDRVAKLAKALSPYDNSSEEELVDKLAGLSDEDLLIQEEIASRLSEGSFIPKMASMPDGHSAQAAYDSFLQDNLYSPEKT